MQREDDRRKKRASIKLFTLSVRHSQTNLEHRRKPEALRRVPCAHEERDRCGVCVCVCGCKFTSESPAKRGLFGNRLIDSANKVSLESFEAGEACPYAV